jgi:vacuolar-type H+-ATPase subunit H
MSDTSNPARIERDLDETRSRLGTHLNELQDRLSPGQVLDDLMGYFRGSEGAAFGENLFANIRANPAAITGIGLAWLMASNPRADATPHSTAPSARLHHYGREDYGATMTRIREAEQGVTRHSDEAEDVYSARLDAARGQAIGLARHAQETTASFSQRVRDVLSAAQQSVSDTAHDVRDQVSGAVSAAAGAIGSLGSSAQGAAGYASGALSHGGQAAGQMGGNLIAALAESPVMLGALGLAAGALLGALVPQSEQEEAALGGIAKQARDTATGLASQGIESGKHVSQAVADKVRESAQGQGLAGGKTPGQLVDAALSGELAGNASEIVKDVLRTGDEAIRKEVAPSAPAHPGSSSAT